MFLCEQTLLIPKSCCNFAAIFWNAVVHASNQIGTRSSTPATKTKKQAITDLLYRRVMINISVVLYNTPKEQVERLISTCRNIDNLYRLYIIDNSAVPSNEYAQTSTKVEYIFNNKNLGYGKAHNIALKKSLEQHIDYHLVVNADVEFSADTISALCKKMDDEQDIALLSPKIYYPNGEIQYLCKLLPTPIDLFGRRFLPESWTLKRKERYELHRSGYNQTMDIPYLSGCFMFLRVSALQDVGLFDERYFMYPEDIDLTRRLHRKYKTLFYPEVSVIHNHERASYKSWRMTLIHIQNMCRYFNKWGWLFDRERNNVNKTILKKYVS